MSTTEDHDSPWKEALELFFQPFLQLLYPDIHEAVDWSQPFTFLDKELQKLTPSSYTGRRHADKLVQVWFQDKRSRWLLIHIEVQGHREVAGLPERDGRIARQRQPFCLAGRGTVDGQTGERRQTASG